MNILFQITMLCEFMFQGYCQYIYFSAFLKNKRTPKTTLLLFLTASCAEYFIYISLYMPVLNILITTFLSIVICILCYENHIGNIILHSCITTCMHHLPLLTGIYTIKSWGLMTLITAQIYSFPMVKWTIKLPKTTQLISKR